MKALLLTLLYLTVMTATTPGRGGGGDMSPDRRR